MSTNDIRDHLKEIYGVTVSPDLISTVTDGITDELKSEPGAELAMRSVAALNDALRRTEDPRRALELVLPTSPTRGVVGLVEPHVAARLHDPAR